MKDVQIFMICKMEELDMVPRSTLVRIHRLHLRAVKSLRLNRCWIYNDMWCRSEGGNQEAVDTLEMRERTGTGLL